PKPEASQSQNPPAAQPQAQAPPAAGMAAPSRSSTSKGAAAAPATKRASGESETAIENDLYRIVFTNRGGSVKSWVLKKYKDKPDGNPLELVNKVAAEKYGYPLSLWLYDESLRAKVNSALYVATSTSSRAPAEVTFEYSEADLTVQKTYEFDHSYVVEMQTSVESKGAAVTALPM